MRCRFERRFIRIFLIIFIKIPPKEGSSTSVPVISYDLGEKYSYCSEMNLLRNYGGNNEF